MISVIRFEFSMSFFFAVYAAILYFLAKENLENQNHVLWICGLLGFLAIIFFIGGIIDFVAQNRKE